MFSSCNIRILHLYFWISTMHACMQFQTNTYALADHVWVSECILVVKCVFSLSWKLFGGTCSYILQNKIIVCNLQVCLKMSLQHYVGSFALIEWNLQSLTELLDDCNIFSDAHCWLSLWLLLMCWKLRIDCEWICKA